MNGILLSSGYYPYAVDQPDWQMSFLKNIRNIFSLEPWPDPERFKLYGNNLTIHEDDVRQVELIPAENYQYAKDEAAKIARFAEEHFDGTGWTALYEREEPPIKLGDRQISLLQFVRPFVKEGFRLTDIRLTGSHSNFRNNLALVKNNFVFYISLKSQWIGAIYFNKEVVDHQLQPQIILSLSQTHNLILADWWKLKIVDTRIEHEVEQYLALE